MTEPSANGQQSEQDALRAQVQPRPVPIAWTMVTQEFVNPQAEGGLERTFLVGMSLHSATGVAVSFFDPTSAKRLAADLRRFANEAEQRKSGLWTPPAPGLPDLSES